MHKITSRQCKAARSLLKWNVHDLSSRLRSIPPKRIESFERGIVHIQEWENDEIVKILRKQGIEFHSDFEVLLKTAACEVEVKHSMHGDGARIVLNSDMTIVSDSSATAVPLGAAQVNVSKENKENQSDNEE